MDSRVVGVGGEVKVDEGAGLGSASSTGRVRQGGIRV